MSYLIEIFENIVVTKDSTYLPKVKEYINVCYRWAEKSKEADFFIGNAMSIDDETIDYSRISYKEIVEAIENIDGILAIRIGCQTEVSAFTALGYQYWKDLINNKENLDFDGFRYSLMEMYECETEVAYYTLGKQNNCVEIDRNQASNVRYWYTMNFEFEVEGEKEDTNVVIQKMQSIHQNKYAEFDSVDLVDGELEVGDEPTFTGMCLDFQYIDNTLSILQEICDYCTNKAIPFRIEGHFFPVFSEIDFKFLSIFTEEGVVKTKYYKV